MTRYLENMLNIIRAGWIDRKITGRYNSFNRDADDDGRWVTTEKKHKLHINGEGEIDKGNPHVVAAINAKKKSGSSISANSTTPKKTYTKTEALETSGKSQQYRTVLEVCKSKKVSYKDVEPHSSQPTEEEIIANIAGGDETVGSCSSLALAYCGNKAGYNVTDFRGGTSRVTFGTMSNVKEIANLSDVSSSEQIEYDDYVGAKKLLDTVQEGKEYYLATGRHASIVRKNPGNWNIWNFNRR